MSASADLKLKNKSVPRLVASYAFTTLIALLLNSVYNLTDTLFVSWGVGVNASGGVSVVLPFVLLQGAVSTALGGGAASIISRKLGEGNRREAGEVALNAMITFYITALAVTAVGFALMEPLLRVMGVTGDIYAYSKQYFIIVLAGNVFSTGFSSIIHAEGKMLYGLLIWVIPITVNIILDAVFILVLGWGVRGSAAATVICQFTSFCMMVIFFTRFTSLEFTSAKLSIRRVGEVLGIGLPSLVQMGSLSILTLVINNVLSTTGGTLGVNTFAFIGKLVAFAIVPFTAVTQALAPIVGYNYGAKNRERIKSTVIFCIVTCFVYALLALILTESIPSYLMKIFTSEKAVVSSGAHALRILAVALIFTPLPMLSGAVYQAEGKKLPALAMYSANVIFVIPLVFAFGLNFGMNGVWWAYVGASVCATVVSAVSLTVSAKKSSKLSKSSLSDLASISPEDEIALACKGTEN